MEIEKIRSGIIKFTLFGGIQFVVLTILAMICYPGGTVKNHAAERYLFFENFFSDLGRSSDFEGASNLISMLMFSSALFLLGLSVFLFFYIMPTLFPKERKTNLISGANRIIGMVAGLCFMGVAFTPWDLYYDEHVFCVKLGFRFLLLACILLGVNIYKTPYFPSKYSRIIWGISIILFGYILLLSFGPKPWESREGLILQVVGQKIIVYLLIFGIMALAFGANKVQKAMRNGEFEREVD